MMKNLPSLVSSRKFLRAFALASLGALAITVQPALAQQTVFSRGENTSGLWWDDNPANLPWFYVTANNSQNRPDNPINTANFLKIGHNNNLTMTVNGTFFWLGSLEIQSSASSSRTYNSSSGGGWSFRTSGEGFTNNSTGNQTVNVEVGIDAATVLFRANASNNNTFSTNFYLNNNTADFGGSSSNGRFTLNGVVSGTNGSIVKNGTGTLWLGASNTFGGGVTLNDGTIRMGANSTVTSGIVTNGSFGTGTLTVNGGRIMPGGAGAFYLKTMLVNSNFSINSGIFNGSDNGRASFAGIMDLAGGTRTITLGRWTNALGTLLGGQESFRFFSNNLLAATITNGTVRFARDAAGTASDYVSVNFSGGMAIGANVGITIGSNVITTFASGDPWGTLTNPAVTVEEGGYFNLSTDVNARNARVQSLSGTGIVTSLANAASAQSSTLTISNVSAADSSTFSGRLVEGNLLNTTLGTSATNVTLALTKAGVGTLTLVGSNNYTGATTISGGALQLGNGGTTGSLGISGALVNNGTLIFNRSDNISQGTDFTSAGISGTGVLNKLGSATLTLNASNSYSGGTVISGGALQVGAGGTAGSLSTSSTITNNGTLVFSRSDNISQGTDFSTAAISGSGNISKLGAGTLTLTANNTYTGKLAVGAGAVSVSSDARIGATPGASTADAITLSNGGKLLTTTGFSFNANRGITLGAGGGVLEVSSGQTTVNPAGQIIAGSSLTKTGAGTLTLTAANTYSGGTVINDGFVRLQTSSVLSGSNIVSGALGVGNITINGGGILGGSQTLNATNITINSNFAVNSGTSGLNGRLSLGANLIDLTGGTRTVSLGRLTTAATTLQGGLESLRLITNGTFYTPTITNGTLRFVRDVVGTSSDFASVNFGVVGTRFAGNSGFIVGTNIITTFGPGNAFTNASGDLPNVATEDGGIFNLGTTNGVNSQTIRSLSGTAGYVTTLANLSGTNSNNATLTISNLVGDNFNYAGQIVAGSTLNAALGTQATNANLALTKTGSGTQVLSGNNSYGGATTISAGVLTFANTNAKSVNSQVTVQSNAVIGLGVGGAGGYDEATITSIISNTATGYTMNVGSIVGIDTTAGNFSYGTGIANSRELWKLGANTLTLTSGSGRTGATAVTGGTLELNATSGQAAGGTSGITVRSGATLLIAKSDQVNDAAAITLSGGTIAKGSGVDETMGNLSLTSGSTLDYGSGTAGTLTFGTYAPSLGTKLTINGFSLGNTLRFIGSDLTAFINASYTGSSFDNGYFAINGMEASAFGGFRSGWDSGSSTFTITSVPEPSTVLAAIGLAGLMLWPVGRRLLARRKA
jgi:fibronectin-binding autotransporter adhesin